MRSVFSPPPKIPTAVCSRCGLDAGAPIVVKLENVARCSNIAACEMRQRRTANRNKERTDSQRAKAKP
jgi:hypothetical protein